jgi:chromosome segregation protein
VGPNGSGKSNIFDSLLFALGESSLRRMRVTSSPTLINLLAKPNPDTKVRSAYVKVSFAGDERIEIERQVKSDGKIRYRMNGNPSTRQQVVDVLRSHNCSIDDTNTITQGEISSIGNLNPKQRRELIDIAAGIKEFNDKKAVALKELDRVDARLNEANITLREREGFLSGLEKEKKDAERYNGLTENSKRIGYTILRNRERQISASYESATGRYMEREDASRDLEKKAKLMDESIRSSSLDREAVSTKLNESSVETNAANKVIEDINKRIAVKSSEMTMTEERIKEATVRVESLKSEQKAIIEKIKTAESTISALEKEYGKKHAELAKYDPDEMVTDTGSLTKEYEEIQKKTGLMSKEIEELAQVTFEGSSSISESGRRLQEIESSIENERVELDEKSKTLKALEKAIAATTTELEMVMKSAKELEEKAKSITGSLSKLDEENINLRYSLAATDGGDRYGTILSKELGSSFHGRVQDLCSYDEKYVSAITASATSRMNFYVVDSAEAADKAIKTLKAKGLGRASFIPLEDILVRDSQSKAPKTATPLIGLVKFEKKYEKAFQFVFGNTYLVESIAAAKKIGFGGGRFVTLEGDLVEPAGTITGGSMKLSLSAPLIQKKLNDVETRKKEILAEQASIEEEMGMKRLSAGRLESEKLGKGAESKHLRARADQLSGSIAELERKKADIESQLKSREASNKKYSMRKDEIAQSLEKLLKEEANIYSRISAALDGSKGRRISKEEADAFRELKEQVRQFEIDIAGGKKEVEISQERKLEIGTAKAKEEAELSRLKAVKGPGIKDISELEKSKEELQNKMKGNNDSTRSLVEKLNEIDAQITKVGFEKGKIMAEIEKIMREQIATDAEKSQLQTRLSDIKAELMAYQGIEEVEERDVKALEEALAASKAQITAIGNVNLKAPEMFDLKSSEVVSAREKLMMLEGEKGSITGMIDEIDSKKLSIFMQTLEQVNRNFGKLYSAVFEGTASLELSDPKTPFDSGLLVKIKPKNGKTTGIELMSGGQKSMIALVLVFAIQMRNPMALYIFDEIDAALDKDNSKKLSGLIKQLSSSSQFIVISHNDEMIISSDIAIGVVSSERISKAFGIEVTGQKLAQQSGA